MCGSKFLIWYFLWICFVFMNFYKINPVSCQLFRTKQENPSLPLKNSYKSFACSNLGQSTQLLLQHRGYQMKPFFFFFLAQKHLTKSHTIVFCRLWSPITWTTLFFFLTLICPFNSSPLKHIICTRNESTTTATELSLCSIHHSH